jgi:hypothetical protein
MFFRMLQPAPHARQPALLFARLDAEIGDGEVSLASPSLMLYCTRVNGRGRAMRAWIDRTNDGLSGMPADGISLPLKKGDFGTSRWAGSKVRLHQPRNWAEGA